MKFSELPFELQQVLKRITRKHKFEIGSDFLAINQHEYSEAFWQLYSSKVRDEMGKPITAKAGLDFIAVLNEYILTNSRKLPGLKIRNPVLIKRPKPPIREIYASHLPIIDTLDQKFFKEPDFALDQSAIEQGTFIEIKFFLGQILYCAVRFGGLLRPALLKSLMHAILNHKCYQFRHVVWFELVDANDIETVWIPDPYTMTLLPRAFKLSNQHRWKECLVKHQLTFFACVKFYLSRCSIANVNKLTAKELFTLVEARLSLTQTPCHLPVLSGREPNLPLEPLAFRRLITMPPFTRPVSSVEFRTNATSNVAASVTSSSTIFEEFLHRQQSYPNRTIQSHTDCIKVIQMVKGTLFLHNARNIGTAKGTTSIAEVSQKLQSFAASTDFVLLPM